MIELVLLDNRIEKSHTEVPGWDGHFGFGGSGDGAGSGSGEGWGSGEGNGSGEGLLLRRERTLLAVVNPEYQCLHRHPRFSVLFSIPAPPSFGKPIRRCFSLLAHADSLHIMRHGLQDADRGST